MAKKFIGIDVGTYNIKLADITVNKKSITIGGFAVIRTPRFLVQSGRLTESEELVSLLKEAIKNNVLKHRKAIVIINDSLIVTRDMVLPAVKPKELEQMVKLEASQYLYNDISDYTIRHKILSTSEQDSQKINYIMMSSIKNDLAMDFYEVLQRVGLKLLSFDTSINGMLKYSKNALEASMGKTIALLDIGASMARIVIVREGIPISQQILNHSSQKIDLLIANILNIDREEAESLKIKYDLTSQTNDFLGDEYSNTVGPVINAQIDLLLNDAYKHIQNYTLKNSSNPVSEIWLAGGASRMKGLDNYIQDSFSIPCSVVKTGGFANFSLEDKLKFAGTHKIEEDFPLFTNLIGAVCREE